jgi:hypothetical protein
MSSPRHNLGTESPRDPFYTRWQIVAGEMGLREVEYDKPDSSIVGEYRNHRIGVWYSSRISYGNGDDESAKTIFEVGFENTYGVEFSGGHFRRILTGNPDYDDELYDLNEKGYRARARRYLEKQSPMNQTPV